VLAVLWYRLPAVVYAAALYWASSKSRLPLPRWGLGFEDKIVHVLAFGLLAWLVFRALSLPRPIVSRVVAVAALLCFAYALSDEWHQSYVPGRTFDLWDLCADAAGIALVLGFQGVRARATRSNG